MNFLATHASRDITIACALLAVIAIDLLRRIRHRPSHLMAATFLGSTLAVGLIRGAAYALQSGGRSPVFLALAVLLVVVGWYMLFGPWEPYTKVAVFGTFLGWIVYEQWALDPTSANTERAIAAGSALIPAVIWCWLFLKYHTERLVAVLLLFLAGMLSTIPILFYDALTRHAVTLNFFFFSITPLSFQSVARLFVQSGLGVQGTTAILLTSFLSFTCVAVVEEMSKYWAMRHSAPQFFRSIDDVLQLSIMVAIGFAFAENVINPTYFTAFVREYLLHGAARDVRAFLGNVLGRSVLTSMVHIVSTGVLGYFSGLAFFAPSYLADRAMLGLTSRVRSVLARLLHVSEIRLFRVQMLAMGICAAVFLHGMFNLLVSLGDILPGSPQTLRDVLPMLPSVFERVPLLLVPALLYVVGGFWLLTGLFLLQSSERERGQKRIAEEFVVAP